MHVRELIGRKGPGAVTISVGTGLGEAARLLMEHNIGGLPVLAASGSVVGFLAERDVVRAVDQDASNPREVPVERVMRRPAPTCSGEDTLHDVMARMTRDRLRHLIVMDQGRIAGVVSVGDLVKVRLEQLETEAGVLRDYVAAHRAVL